MFCGAAFVRRSLAIATVLPFLALPSRAEKLTELPETPYGAFLAGDDLLAVGSDQKLWVRHLQSDPEWHLIALPGFGTEYSGNWFACDGVRCVFSVRQNAMTRQFLYQLADGKAVPLAIDAAGSLGWADGIFFYASLSNGHRIVRAYTPKNAFDRAVGEIRPGELTAVFPIDGRPILVAYTYAGDVRNLSSEDTPVASHAGLKEGFVVSNDALIEYDGWMDGHPYREGLRSVVAFKLERSAGGGLSGNGSALFAMPTSGPLLESNALAADARGDVVGIFNWPKGRYLASICRAEDGAYGLKVLTNLRRDESVSLSSSMAAAGFVLRQEDLTHSAHYRVVRLSPSEHGSANRKCNDTTGTFTESGIAVATNDTFSTTRYEAVSADGTKVPYVVLAPKGDVRRILIDVYGAYGAMRDFSFYHQRTLAYLAEQHAAIAYPIVRGDGNSGYDYAVASMTPNRRKAVEDVAAVAADIAKRYPSLDAKPTVRGASAGAWLAMKSVLTYPDLFAGAMGYSGLYFLKGEHNLAAEGGFFSESDDLTPDLSRLGKACPRQHFRFLHAKDDLKAPYASAQRFFEAVKAAGCPAESVTFETGGHPIEIPVANKDDGDRRLRAWFTPF